MLIAGSVADGALAQVTAGSSVASARASEDNFVRDRNIAVNQRSHPDYEARGARVGGFKVFPKVATTVENSDNIYAAKTNEVSDVIWRVKPEVTVVSDWTRHSLLGYARGTVSRNKDNKSENYDDYTFGAIGRIDVVRGAEIDLGASYGKATEPRNSPNATTGAKEPTQYDTTSANLGGSREFNRLRLSTRFDIVKTDYQDSRTGPGVVIDQDYRDRTTTSLLGRADYAVSPDTALFVEVSGNKRDYRLGKPAVLLNRDSNGILALAGANFELGAAFRGEVGLGYIRQSYDDAKFKDFSGLGGRAQLEWFASELSTVTVTGARTIEESVLTKSGSYTSDNFNARIDHELMRNVLLAANVGYGKDGYQGISREDKNLSAGVSGTYLLNRNVGLNLAYNYAERTSSGLVADKGQEFKVNKLSATVTLQF